MTSNINELSVVVFKQRKLCILIINMRFYGFITFIKAVVEEWFRSFTLVEFIYIQIYYKLYLNKQCYSINTALQEKNIYNHGVGLVYIADAV